MKCLPMLGIAILATGLLSACGPSKPERLLSQPPASARTGAPLPLAQVERPVDLARFDSDPCALLTKDQVAAVVADPPDDVRANRQTVPPAFGCSWTNHGGALVSAAKPIESPKTLDELAASPLKEDGKLEPWTETSVDGLPAVVYHVFGHTDECSVSVQVTEEQMLTFDIQGKDLPGSYWDKDRCGGVAKMAELVIGNLRQS
ncbi:DUF3558 domain-containing protein [Amycolatopsis sp. NBC_01307]|uniref:DUF3558 domain-containing protein n=1 Tax=Amycolatopsis sp. NBC_01307 TaxID=2903561 RepID=UPI002E0D1AFB|nr:DUF3558 domain-containing protein [Amycolatopsis sp. NBC_01307]